MAIKIITTEDGSHSLFDEQLNETYHSTRGAVGESMHVFVEHGLKYFSQPKTLKVFEVGFGTGLNALLTAQYAKKHAIAIDYVTLEPFPVSQEVVAQLNYGDEDQQLFRTIHDAPWGLKSGVMPYFTITKHQEKLASFQTDQQFDIVFFDAFAPSKQAELWTMEPLQTCFDLLKQGGILTTYCAQGQFKRNLRAIGFEVQALAGAMGKKEMVRAIKP